MMTTFVLLERPTRADLHALTVSVGRLEDGEATLRVPYGLFLASALDYGLAIQAILTWGLQQSEAILELEEASPTPTVIRTSLETSDHFLVAGLVAKRVVSSSGLDVTDMMSQLIDEVLPARNALSATMLSPGERLTIVLPSFIPRLNHSPDLHAETNGEWGIEEEARSLYHDIWPERDKPSSLRDPMLSQGEIRQGTEEAAHVKRMAWPATHPLWPSGEEFKTLASRTLEPRGIAALALQATRVQQKPISDEIGEVLFELVQNTEWHASRMAGGRTGRNIRLISFSSQTLTATDIEGLRAGDPAFAAYLTSCMTAAPGGVSGSLTVGVASIIDTGIGLARSAALRSGQEPNVTDDNEVYLLMDALSQTIRVSHRQLGNIGLPRVQQLLSNLRGFMYIRTGRLEIRRDFYSHPFEPIDPLTAKQPRREQFINWVPLDSDLVIGERVGTDVTFVVPLDYPAEQS